MRGLLIGPIVAPLGYSIAMAADAVSRGRTFSVAEALHELGVILAFGVPVSYAAVLVWGVPIVVALRKLGALRASTLVVAGALGGVIVAWWLASHQQGALFRVRMPVALGAALGALVGGTSWWAGRSADGTRRRRSSEGR